MSDDLDDLIRRAMKTLDSQVPSGYFETLTERTLGRLEKDMQTEGEGSSTPGVADPPPREEDSGLHDIRSLASSQRMQLKRTSQNPITTDDDELASSSAGWKAIALPEPAKIVSLPELSELPEKSANRTSRKHIELGAPRSIDQAPVTPIAAAPAKKKSSGGKIVLAVVGMGLAAAAGVTLFLTMNNQDASAPAVAQGHGARDDARDRAVASTTAEAKPAAPAAQAPTPTVESVPSIPTEGAAMGSASAVADVSTAAAAPSATPEPAKIAVAGKKTKPSKAVDKRESKPEKPVSAVDAKGGGAKKAAPPSGSAKDGEMGGLDDLLKEAGVKNNKPDTTKPKLDKTSLDSGDIRKAMSAVQGKAQACYAGQQGTANVKLSVAPNGKVQKVTVTGVFAGTPVAACVEAAVKGASFPPWDGGPQSVSYSYLLSE